MTDTPASTQPQPPAMPTPVNNLPEKVRALFTGFKGIFAGALGAAPANGLAHATKVQSNSRSNTYAWLGQSSVFRKWVGNRVAQAVAKCSYVITNVTWEMTQTVAKEDIEDDQVGIYTPLISDMGQSANRHVDAQIYAAYFSGDTNLCFDGQPYFDTAHPVQFDDEGNPVTGTEQAPAPTFSNFMAPGEGEVAGAKWVLMDCSRPICPVLYQERKAPVFVSKTALTDEFVFNTNYFEFGADKRDAVGYTLPQFAVMSTAPLTPANFERAFKMLEEMKGDKGQPLGIKPTHLLTSPANRAASNFLTQTYINGTTNPYLNAVERVITPYFCALIEP